MREGAQGCGTPSEPREGSPPARLSAPNTKLKPCRSGWGGVRITRVGTSREEAQRQVWEGTEGSVQVWSLHRAGLEGAGRRGDRSAGAINSLKTC